MKEKILAQLVKKFPGVSKKFLGLWADKLATKVTEETEIQGAVDELDNLPVPITDLANEYQREGDRRVSEAEAAWRRKNPGRPLPKTEDDDPADPPKPSDDVPAWAKTMMTELQSLKAERVQGTMRTRLAEKLKDKKIPERFYSKRALPEKEEDLDTFAEEIEKDWDDFRQEQVDAGLMSATPPAGGSGTGAETRGNSKVLDAEIEAWASTGKSSK